MSTPPTPAQKRPTIAGRITRSARNLGALALLVGGPAVAAPALSVQDLVAMPLDRLLDIEATGSSRFGARGSESATAVTVIRAEDIRTFGYRTLAEALRSVKGLVLASDRAFAYLGVRGTPPPANFNVRVLLLIDGNRVNDTVNDQGLIGWEFPLDIDLVERIEFIPGQGSAIHGANALFGVINVVTRSASSGPDWQSALAIGELGRRQARLTGRTRLGDDAQLLVSGTWRSFDGAPVAYTGPASCDPADPACPQMVSGVAAGVDAESGRKLFAKLEWGGLSVMLLNASRDGRWLGADGLRRGDERNQHHDRETLADLAWRQPLGKAEQWKLRLYGGAYDLNAHYAIDGPGDVVINDHAHSRWWGLETTLASERFDRHKLGVGAELEISPHRDQRIRVEGDPAPLMDNRFEGKRASLYAEDQWHATDVLTLTGGLRWDRSTASSSRLSPRLAAAWQAAPGWLLKWVRGSAFRPPSSFEMHYGIEGGGGLRPNPGLQGEKVRGDDLVLEWHGDDDQRFTLSAYRTRADGLIFPRGGPDGVPYLDNAVDIRDRGLEAEYERQWRGGPRLRVNWSLHRAQSSYTGTPLPTDTRHLAKLMLSWPLGQGLETGWQSIYTGRRRTEQEPARLISDLNLSARLADGRVRVSLAVYNIGQRHEPRWLADNLTQTVSPSDGRQIGLKIEAQL